MVCVCGAANHHDGLCGIVRIITANLRGWVVSRIGTNWDPALVRWIHVMDHWFHREPAGSPQEARGYTLRKHCQIDSSTWCGREVMNDSSCSGNKGGTMWPGSSTGQNGCLFPWMTSVAYWMESLCFLSSALLKFLLLSCTLRCLWACPQLFGLK